MTDFPLNDPLAVQRWETSLDYEAEILSYFRKFMGKGPNNMVVIREHLEKAAGEKITVGLAMKLAGDGIEGDNIIKNTEAEEAITTHNDTLFINQRRKGTKSKGKMSEQRVPYPMRKLGRDKLAIWESEDIDQQIMMYAAGRVHGGSTLNPGYHVLTSWAGRANNDLTVPNSTHQFYAGSATGQADLTSADKLKPKEVEKLVARAKVTDPMIQPIMHNAANKFILLMHTFSAFDLRTGYSTGDWGDIRKNTDGKESLIYKDALGEIGGVILHEHRGVIRYAGDNVTVGRNLFLGAQAVMIAYGGGGGQNKYTWFEEYDDRGNALSITVGLIYGVSEITYNSKRFGMFAFDAACADPTT